MSAINNQEVSGRVQLLETLYVETFPAVAAYISRRGGTQEDARDVFHDALVAYIEKTGTQQAAVNNRQAYLLGTAKNLWAKRFNEVKSRSPEIDTVQEGGAYQEVSAPGVMSLILSAGQKCLEMLSAYYYEKLDMENLALRFGFPGARSATVQKYKCLEKIKATVKEKSLCYEDFLD